MLALVTSSNTIDNIAPRLEILYKKVQETEEELYHYPFERLLEDLKNTSKLLFVDNVDGEIQSFAVLDFMQYDKLRSFRILYSAGKITEDWPAHIKFFEEFGKKFHINFIEVWGRPGWGKILKNHGFGTKVVNYVKRLQ